MSQNIKQQYEKKNKNIRDAIFEETKLKLFQNQKETWAPGRVTRSIKKRTPNPETLY